MTNNVSFRNIAALATAAVPEAEVSLHSLSHSPMIWFKLDGRLVATMIKPQGERLWQATSFATGPGEKPALFTTDVDYLPRSKAVRKCCDALRQQAGL